MGLAFTVKRGAGALFLLSLAGITWLSLAPISESVSVHTWDKLNHAAAYFCLGILLDTGFRPGIQTRWKLFGLLCYSSLMELCQYFLPYRECSLPDILANTTGLVLAAAAVLAFRQTRLYRMLFQLGGF